MTDGGRACTRPAGARFRRAGRRDRVVATGLAGLLAAALTLSCGSSGTTAAPDDGPEPLRLTVRAHVLSSSLAPFDAALTDADVEELFRRANDIWARAGIAWELESVVREAADPAGETELEQELQSGGQVTVELLLGLLPAGRRLVDDWDVYLVRDLAGLAGVPGVYLSSLPAVVFSEVDPAGLDDPGRILAHELGHSLTLEHVPCTPAGNLMSPGCEAADRTRLTDAQIDQARAQAETGSPATF